MKRAAIAILVFAVLGFVGGLLYGQLTGTVVPNIKEQRAAGPTREVSKDWHSDKFSPGHTQHVINLRLECNECHDPSRADFAEVDIGVCTACHEEQSEYPHVDQDGEVTECMTCHGFKFDSDADGPWDCARCHGPFDTPTYSGLAMHDSIACANCHVPHLPIEETVGRCTDCHEELQVRHGRPELSGTCADCHGGHKLASEAAACMECHRAEEPRVPKTATFTGGHSECVDCHKPHSFSAASALRCESCHKRQPVLAARTARDHRQCSSCHQPHAVQGANDNTCKRCHEEVASNHPVENKGDCVSCHDPHPKRASQIAMQCSSCHEEASSERAFHAKKTVCTDCHQPHGFDLASVDERKFCADCHAPQVRLTKRIADHSSCASCHQGTVHELEAPVACGSCHEEILSGSPKGHQECASCHEPHGGAVAASTACTSCHESLKLPGLHRIADSPQSLGHSDCASCHNVHSSTVRADRASCMTCHDNITTHEPDAKVCTGCHTFISGKPRK